MSFNLNRFNIKFRKLSQAIKRNLNLTKFRIKLNETLYSFRHISNERYRLIYQWTLFSATAITAGTYGLYNTLYLDKYQQFVQMYSAGEPAVLDEKLELLALRTWNQSHVARKVKLLELLKFFPSVGCEPFNAGSFESRFGAIIGLPYNFTYETIDDVKTADLQFFGEHDPYMKWRSEAGQQLIQSLVLSEKAKKFAIAREIHNSNTFRVHINICIIAFCTLISIGLGQELINYLNIRRSLKPRLAIRIASIVIGVSLWLILNELLDNNWNITADEKAVKQGEEYFEGALEYYDKLRNRNKALYELLDDRGKKMYTKDGDPKGIFGTTAFSISKRLEHLQQFDPKKQSHQKQENTESIE